jgi:outer membrane protein OmpA-like peptidoglycan-associated protein
MAGILSEVEEQATQERGLAGPSNPRAQHAYDGYVKTPPSSPGWGWAFGATAMGLALILAAIFGLWLLRSVRRLNRQVAHLNRQTEQLNQRLQGAEQHVKSLDQKASQAATSQASAAPVATARPDQAPDGVPDRAPDRVSDQAPQELKDSQAASAAQTQLPLPSNAAAQPPRQATQKTEESRQLRDADLQKLKQSLGQIAETRRTADGVVMTLGEKSTRFDSGKWNLSPQDRGILNRVARVVMPLKGYSIYVNAYTDDTGTNDYDLQLSARRARAVRDALVKAGIDPSLISTKGFGKAKPLVPGRDPKARAANRRVELGIIASTPLSARQPTSKVGTKPSANR